MVTNRIKKLLQLNCTANWGSTGKIAEGIGLAAIARGWKSAIAFGRYSNPSQSHLIKVGSQKDVYLHYARHRLFNSEGLGSKKATLNLIKWISDYGPDIIHLHNIHDHWINYQLLADYLGSINTPVVWTFHDCWAFTGGCTYFDHPKCNKWMDHCSNCVQRGYAVDNSDRNFVVKRRLLSKFADRLTIVTVSHWLEMLCRKSFLKDIDIRLIHNGIDTEKFAPRAKKNNKALIVGVASPWDKRKGLDDIKKLRALIPMEDIDIVLIGLNKRQISKLPEGITGLQRTQSISELAEWYSKGWAFVNATHSDNFPTVNLESLACGTPVITYNTGGSPEAIDHSTGLVIEQGNVEQLATAIISVCNGTHQFSSQECRKRAVDNFNQKTQFDKYIDLYQSLIEKL